MILRLQHGTVSDTTSFYRMWDTMISKYGGHSNFYFDIMNEPYAYSAGSLTNFEAAWLARYPSLPRGHVIVPGTGYDTKLCAEGADSRLNGTLISIHIYGMFGDSHTTEAGWVSDFESALCGYAGRAVLTEFGVPMTTGINYDGPKNGTNLLSYIVDPQLRRHRRRPRIRALPRRDRRGHRERHRGGHLDLHRREQSEMGQKVA